MPTKDKRRDKVHPELLARIDKVLAAMKLIGHPMLLTDGARTAEQQHEIWRQGRERPGKIVTNADGFNTKSNHQIKEDGFGHAVDCCFLTSDGKASWAEHHPWKAYAELCKAVGLKHGIKLNSSTIDWPHAEWI
jgi:peptidoglycan L-alanyl-D-glutamate endopeptidase CwlK